MQDLDAIRLASEVIADLRRQLRAAEVALEMASEPDPDYLD